LLNKLLGDDFDKESANEFDNDLEHSPRELYGRESIHDVNFEAQVIFEAELLEKEPELHVNEDPTPTLSLTMKNQPNRNQLNRNQPNRNLLPGGHQSERRDTRVTTTGGNPCIGKPLTRETRILLQINPASGI
jgi:hypothetical protein